MLVVLGVVVFVITAPLRRDASADAAPGASESEAAGNALAELEARREAKYREIRDAELDHQTGKLSDADYEALDRTLRAEAIEIMHAIDAVSEPAGGAGQDGEDHDPAGDPR